jgi:UDP-N-acetylglucosamine--N-acetylmuramyl-(pentapeptide) pyrophosphoryl-undecaprenol N-acetylglucosamine transferase
MKPTVVVTGAGSGGHITPILAVAAQIKKQRPEVKIVYVGQQGDSLGDIPAADPYIDEVYTVRAGKFRRYHGEGWRQLLDGITFLQNVRDAFYVVIGFFQSLSLLRQLRPEVIFIKGGFVGVPVGLAAASLRQPYITHDSDAIPGLANRIIARWAKWHAVALPKEVYNYPAATTVTTGIPLQSQFKPVNQKLKDEYRGDIDIPKSARMLFIIGGGLGSQRVNQAVSDVLSHLLHDLSDLYVVHVVGRANEAAIKHLYEAELTPGQQQRVKVFGYLEDVYRYSGAADLVITRAGATNLAEFALQAKACIVVPSPFLTGGHQLKNAAYLEEQGAVAVLPEDELTDDSNRLAKLVTTILNDPQTRAALEEKFSKFANANAAEKLAKLILDQINAGR